MEIRGLTVLEANDGYNITFFDCEENNFVKVKASKYEITVGDDSVVNLMSAIEFISNNRHRWCIDKPWFFMKNIK